jgi:hypothetical protein
MNYSLQQEVFIHPETPPNTPVSLPLVQRSSSALSPPSSMSFTSSYYLLPTKDIDYKALLL